MSAGKRNNATPFRAPVTVLIIALIMALAAPSLAFVALLLFQSDTISRRQMEARAAQGVSAISQTLDRELGGMITNLSVLAGSGWIETEEYDLLHRRATEALRNTGWYLIAVDSDLQQILNTRVPWGTPLQRTSDPDSVREAIARGGPWVSNVFMGQTAKKEVFNVVLPLISGERRVAALIMTRDVDKLGDAFQENLPPPGWTYAVLDRNNKLVAGQGPASTDASVLLSLCGKGAEGMREQTFDNITFSSASEALETWDWRACVWTSSEQAAASTTQRWRNFTILTLVVVFVTILSGAALGQMLAGAIRRAASVGKALDAGGDVPEMRSYVREVDDVLATLTRAARRRLSHEQEQAILLNETAHRAKNQIAIASALVRLSARSAQNVDQLRDDIVARLAALGQSIDMMSKTSSGAVQLRELIGAQLQPFGADRERLQLDGPDLGVSPTTAQSLGLVIYEMATNAAKYGAWSAPEGRVHIAWERLDDGGLMLSWLESGGPPPKAQERAGFGSSLIEMMIERTLGGKATRVYTPTGLEATFRLKPEGPLG
ncbi:MAG TPA: sensor histidine kinase [Hyphomonadaceae bacterium]|nr:sensor histidine kinase [Hyphomonadaceae bacterium]